MNPEILKFLHHIIRTYNMDVMHTGTEAEYTIEMDDGTMFGFSCVYTTDERGRPGRYYAVTANMQVLADGFCLDGGKPTEITRNLMELVRNCSNKVLAQEMKARQVGLLNQLETGKIHS